MTPQTTAQNLLLWAAALALAVLLSFLGAVAKQLPGDAAINWRSVAFDVITTITTLAPVVAAGFGLPRLGKEPIANLVSQVGPGPAKAALEDVVIRQEAGVGSAARPVTPDVVGAVADVLHDQVADELERRMKAAPAATEQPTAGRG